MTRYTTILFLPILLGGPSCAPEDGVERTEEGWLQRGSEVASDLTERSVRLGERPLTIDVMRGTITVQGADVDEARFRIERVARGASQSAARSGLDGVRIEESGTADAFELRLTADRRANAEANVIATVPRGARVVIRAGRGDVELADLGGRLDVESRNGHVRADGLRTDTLEVRTIRGNQEIDFAALGARPSLNVRAQRGDVRVMLPPDASLEISVESGVGSIAARGLDLTRERFEERARDTRFRARLGGGAGRLVAMTEVGNVELRAASVPATDVVEEPVED